MRNLAATKSATGALSPDSTDALSLFFRRVGRYPLLSSVEETELAKRIETGDKEAKEEMVNSNLRLVVSIARKYRRRDIALLDLIQDGVIGLMRATEKFDWRRGYKFSTYATWWIRQAIKRGDDNASRTIRFPVHLVARERDIGRAETELAESLRRTPTSREIADVVGLSVRQVGAIQRAGRAVTSLDKPIGEEHGTLGELMPARGPGPSEEVESKLEGDTLRLALVELPQDERTVLELRYGVATDDDPLTIEEVVRHLDITRNRVRKLEKHGLARLAGRREVQALR